MFCRGHYLSDEEKIKAVIENYILKKYPPAIIRVNITEKGWGNTPPSHPVHYKNVDEFMSLNPNCCEIVKSRNLEEGQPQFIELLTGTVSAYAKIKYQVKFIENGEYKSLLSDSSYPISNCGKVTKKWYPWNNPFQFFPSNF